MLIPSRRLDGADILVLSPTPTWPLDYGNRKRIFSVCENIKQRGARIHYLHYPSEGEWRHKYPKAAAEIMAKQWSHYYMAPPTRGLHEPSKGDDHTIDEWWDEGIGKQLEWFFSANHFDAVIVNYTWLSKALEFAPSKTLKVLDAIDRFSSRRDLLESHGISREFFHTTQEEEVKGLERADIVWAIKGEEEEFFRALLENKGDKDTRVTTLLHVERQDLDRDKFPYEENGYLTIGMIGARNNINLTNVKNFLHIALPIFEEYMTPVRILFAGTMCMDLEGYHHPFVELLGRVESVEDFYASLDAAIVPMTFSTGLKIKVGEALAFGVPLISHRHAFEGYPSSHRMHELDSIEEIAMEIIKLAYEPLELTWLQKASIESQSKLLKEVDGAIDDLVKGIKDHRDTAIVILPELAYKRASFYHLHLENIIGSLFDKYKIIFYYPHELDKERVAFLEVCNDWASVFAFQTSDILSQIQYGTSLGDVCEIWNVKLLWNYDKHFDVSPHILDKDIVYFDDHSFYFLSDAKPTLLSDITVESLQKSYMDNRRELIWHYFPFSYNTRLLKGDIWKDRTAGHCNAVYILFSGTFSQYRFWRALFEHTLSGKHKMIWVTEFSDSVEAMPDDRIEVINLVEDVTLLRDQARIAFEINLANSHLIASTVWLMHISDRLIIRPRDMGDETGLIDLDTLHERILRVVEDLGYAKGISEFYNGYAFLVEYLDVIMVKYKENKIKKSLGLI